MTNREKKQRDILDKVLNNYYYGTTDDKLTIDQAISELSKLDAIPTKHDCEKWFDEACGCSICHNLLLKSPIKTKAELREIIEHCNWIITEQKKEIEKLKSIPTSKEVEEAVKRGKDIVGNLYDYKDRVTLQTLIHAVKTPDPIFITNHKDRIKHFDGCQCTVCKGLSPEAVKPKEEVGCEEIADKIFDKLPKFWWKQGTKKTIQIPHPIMLETAQSLAKSLLTKYSIRRRSEV